MGREEKQLALKLEMQLAPMIREAGDLLKGHEARVWSLSEPVHKGLEGAKEAGEALREAEESPDAAAMQAAINHLESALGPARLELKLDQAARMLKEDEGRDLFLSPDTHSKLEKAKEAGEALVKDAEKLRNQILLRMALSDLEFAISAAQSERLKDDRGLSVMGRVDSLLGSLVREGVITEEAKLGMIKEFRDELESDPRAYKLRGMLLAPESMKRICERLLGDHKVYVPEHVQLKFCGGVVLAREKEKVNV